MQRQPQRLGGYMLLRGLQGVRKHLVSLGELLPQVTASGHGAAVAGCLVQKGAALLLSAATPQDPFALQGRHQAVAQADSSVADTQRRLRPHPPSPDWGPAAAEQSSEQHQSHAPDSATDASRDHSGTETWSGSSSYSEAGSRGNSYSDRGDSSGEEQGAGRAPSEEGAERGLVGALADAGRQQGASAGRRALQLRLQGLALDNVDAVEPMKLMLQVGCSEGTGAGSGRGGTTCICQSL